MAISTRIDAAKGVNSTNNASGIVLEASTDNSGYAPYTTGIIQNITAVTTFSAGNAGVHTISGSSVLTVVMPDPSTCAGAEFTFRAASVHAHQISGSGTVFANTSSVGALLALSSSVGSSVALKSDGAVYLVLGHRNPITIT